MGDRGWYTTIVSDSGGGRLWGVVVGDREWYTLIVSGSGREEVMGGGSG